MLGMNCRATLEILLLKRIKLACRFFWLGAVRNNYHLPPWYKEVLYKYELGSKGSARFNAFDNFVTKRRTVLTSLNFVGKL